MLPYRLLTEHISEMLLIVYTPTIGTAIERQLRVRPSPRRCSSVDHPARSRPRSHHGLGPQDVDLIATATEGILGIGDWGVAAASRSPGKLAVYVAAAGLHPPPDHPGRALTLSTTRPCSPRRCTPNRQRASGASDTRDDPIDTYAMATRMFPNALLLGGLSAGNAPHPDQVRLQLPDVQRRHPGHGRGSAGRCASARSGCGSRMRELAGGDPRRRRPRGSGSRMSCGR